MSRVVLFIALSTACGIAHAQTGGGQDTGGNTDVGGNTDTGGNAANTGNATVGGDLGTTEIEERGIETGPIDQTESGFADSGDNGFAGPGNTANFRSRTFSGGGQNQRVITGGSSQTQRQVRPTFRLGFVPSQALLARNRQRAVSRFTTITPRVRELRGMSMSPDQSGAVTIRGQATSRYGSLLAAAIARLEPGVRSVRNEVRVVPLPARPVTPTTVPPAPGPSAPIVNPNQSVPSTQGILPLPPLAPPR